MKTLKAGVVSLIVWILTLTAGALIALVSLPVPLLLSIEFILIVLSIGSCLISIFSFHRFLSHAWAYITAVILWLALLPLLTDASLQRPASPWIQALTSAVAILIIDLMISIGALALCWGWSRGGWGLLTLLPIAMVWAPVIVTLRSSPSQVLEDVLIHPQGASWLPALYCIVCGTLPIAILMSVIDLARSTRREFSKR
jgi:hypothetical protein